MSNTKTVMGQASNQYVAPLDITDVFSTYLYTGNGATQTITNDIDLAGEGGLVWIKARTFSDPLAHMLWDTERGPLKAIFSNTTDAEYSFSNTLTSFNASGFSIGLGGAVSSSGQDYASWTFRKAPKFFDMVTYTGDGAEGRDIPHNLGSVPGMIIVKRTDSSQYGEWYCYHRSLGASKALFLNYTNAAFDYPSWNSTTPTDSVFTVRSAGLTNRSGATYVAYLFAHNDGDGGFGPNADQDIIKCGSFTESTSEQEINLGFEPQWLMIKTSSTTSGWRIFDMMRGFDHGGNSTTSNANLEANSSSAETGSSPYFKPTPTGFTVPSGFFGSGTNYIYIAIRRGPLAPPESGTEVFDVATRTSGLPSFVSSFPVDMALLRKGITAAGGVYNASRLTGTNFLYTNGTDAEATDNGFVWDFMDGWANDGGTSSEVISWMWKRAPSFFDVVAYTGDGIAGHTVSHNLGVAPEMMIVKCRNQTYGGFVYHAGIGEEKALILFNGIYNVNAAATYAAWNNTAPSKSFFTLGNFTNVNQSSDNFIAYLFATLAGVSKVGSYTGNGSSQTIDCGFTAGARFILIKRTDSTGDWYVWDTARGIVAGNDPHLSLNTTAAEVTSDDSVDPDNSGFIVNQLAATNINVTSASYIFYAVA